MQLDKTTAVRILKSFVRREWTAGEITQILADCPTLEDLFHFIATRPDFSERFPMASRALGEQKVSSSGIRLGGACRDELRFAKTRLVQDLRAKLFEAQKRWAASIQAGGEIETEIRSLRKWLAALEPAPAAETKARRPEPARMPVRPLNAGATLVNLHRLDTANAGDLACGPADYFPTDFGAKLEITGCDQRLYPDLAPLERWFREISGKVLVVGGGGLLDQAFFKWSIQKIGSLDHKKIIWGAGHNDFSVTSWSHAHWDYRSDLEAFDLVGVRDWGTRHEWVPCASCLSPRFDRTYEIKHPLAAYLHTRTNGCPKELEAELGLPAGTPILYNDAGFETVVEFLGSAELVVTNCYHGIYWATLLGRKVVGIPISSKFFSLKHPVPLSHYHDWARFGRLATIYPEALGECREANLRFREKVLDFASS